MQCVSQSRGVLLSGSLAIALAVVGGCSQQPASAPAQPGPAAAAPAAPVQSPADRGRVLVQVGGCNDCHTTKKLGPQGPEPDMDKELSGHPQGISVTSLYKPAKGSPWTIATTDTLTSWSGPWGTSFAANLTPDPTGLKDGVWSEASFLSAMKTGQHRGKGRAILPPMPWQMYSKLSDDDLKAIWAYLQTIKPVANEVPDPIAPGK